MTSGSDQATPQARIKIRRAELGDLRELSELLALSFHATEGRSPWFYPLLKFSIQEDLRLRFKHPPAEYVCWVAVTASVPEAILGTIELSIRPQNSCAWSGIPGILLNHQSRAPYISNLAVLEHCRRQGVASQLLESCKQTALQWGHKEIFLHVLESNQAARKLYANAGYYLQRPDPSWESWLFQQSQRLLLRRPLISG